MPEKAGKSDNLTKPLNKHRAMREDDKQVRQQDILNAALQLYAVKNFQSLTMAEIAAATGLAKGTLYLYFKTKEELFLAVQEQQLYAWFDEVDSQLEQSLQLNIMELVKLFGQTLQKRPALTRLLALSNTVLEQNIEAEAALNYKQRLLSHLNRTGLLIENCLPFIRPPGQGALLLIQMQALVVGLQNLADPPQVVRQLLQRPELQILNVNFDTEFARMLGLLLEGLAKENNHNEVYAK